MKIIDAEVMIGDKGFKQQRRAAQARTRSLNEAVKGFMISYIEYVERKVLRKVLNRKEG